ncbi:MAG: molybdopterin cofactor-binding domain-containing protein [Opitutus sp.]
MSAEDPSPDAGRPPGLADPLYRFAVTRRDFVKTFVGGLAVLWLLDSNLLAQAESGHGGRDRHSRPKELAAWLHIAANGAVTVFTGKAEVGQNIRTSLTQAVAEELPTPLTSITIVLADTSLVPWDAGTFGSRTTPVMNLQLRRVAATAREALIDLAAKKWNVARETLQASGGKVRRNTESKGAVNEIGFGELTQGEKLVLEVSDNIALKPATAWTVAGTSVPKVDGRSFVTGSHRYTTDFVSVEEIARSDVKRSDGSAISGLLHGRVLRPAAFGATMVSLDTAAAEAMPGVTVVRDGDFVGVTAPTEHQAMQAVAALRAEWKPSPQISERELFDHLRASAPSAPAINAASSGPGELRQTYSVAYIAHAPLEPRAAVAMWEGDQLTVWTGSQRPFGVQEELASTFKMPEEKVRVIVPDTGSGYGGKHTGEAAIEAARLAKAARRPVKLVWTREEEFTWAYFRPAGVIDVRSVVDGKGRLTQWEHHNINSGNAGIALLYDVPAAVTKFHESKSPLRQGSYRALAATANHFARETHIDECARAARRDPLEFRLMNLKDERLRAVLQAATQAFGWEPNVRLSGRGVGVAIGADKGGYLATCAEVVVDSASGQIAVRRVVQAFECGAIVNPEHLKNQIEGAIVQGLGGALFEAVRFGEGRIANPRFSAYRVPRFSDLPKIEIVLLDRKDLPSAGAGEAPIVGIAPAIGNAIFDATGIRLRALPLVPQGLKPKEAASA